jgi:hypothetical protein
MAWLNGWSYRIRITISGSSGAGTNYQVLLKIGESSSAIDCDFHLDGRSANFPSDKNDGGDLRFTADDGHTLLSFWVENVFFYSPDRIAWVWVKVSADLGTSQTIYCYFGNPEATNLSNGSDTFLFFDDFDTLDTTIWDAWYMQQTESYVYGVSGSSYLQSRNTLIPGNSNRRVRARMWLSNYPYAEVWCRWFYDSLNYIQQGQFSNSCYVCVMVDGQLETMPYFSNAYTNQWNIHDLGRAGTDYYALVVNEYSLATGTYSFSETDSVFENDLYIQLYFWQVDSRCDYVLIAKYVYPEPAFSSAGEIEVAPPSRPSSRRLLLMPI